MPLNSLICQDDIAKMIYMLEDARKDTRNVGQMLELDQVRVNTSKSKFVILAPQKWRTELLKEAEANPIKMGETTIENSKSEKYMGGQIHKDRQQQE